MSVIDPKIVNRLRALLTLAEDKAATEAEAQAALNHAQTLMHKYNLTMATLEASGGKAEGRVKDETAKNLMFQWQQRLFAVVAEVNFCHFELREKTTRSGERIKGGYQIIGRQSNVISTRNMYEYLTQTIARLVKQECGSSAQEQFTKYANSFRIGCVDRLADRLRSRHREKLEEQSRQAREANAARNHPGSTANALVVVMEDFAQQEQDANNEVRLGLEPGTLARRRKERELEQQRRLAEIEEKKAAFIAEGHDPEVAYYLAHGYSLERANQMARPTPSKPETEAQRRKREKREAAQERRYQAWHRREARKYDDSGYTAGARAGEDISLDEQIDHAERKKLGQG